MTALRCVICDCPVTVHMSFCRPCGDAYDRWNRLEATTMELIQWVAKRARRLKPSGRVMPGKETT